MINAFHITKLRLAINSCYNYYRTLVFSLDSIVSVNILLDDKDVGVVDHVTGPLYVAKWQPSDYSNGIHSITVIAKVCYFSKLNVYDKSFLG